MRDVRSLLHSLGPALPATGRAEVLRASAGALAGILACTLLALALPMAAGLPVMLVAPLGASAVLVFAVPNAPLAQPWSAVVGNTVSALAAVAVLHLVPQPWAAAVAVGAAILAMLLFRALHPPGGAVALLSALTPGPVLEAGFAFALVPVGLMTLTLVLAGIAFNRATGRVYPFRQTPRAEAPLRLGLAEDELAGLLARFNQAPNIGVADLGRLLAAAEHEAAGHRFDGVTCADVMTRNLVTVPPELPLAEVARRFRRHAIKSLPVVDGAGSFRGLILQADVIDALLPRGPLARRRTTAAEVMRAAETAVAQDTPVGRVLNRLAAQGAETVPVVHEGQLAGVITRSDILALLLRGSERRAVA